ncbi:MAG: DNA-directed RNA polymerase subunit D [Promethearchaeota archaeon]
MNVEIIDEVLEEGPQRLEFVVEGVSAKFLNTLRRIILAQVPVLAIEEVIFIENSSPLFDEVIAHRLGLIPLTTDLEKYNFPHECSCEGDGCTLCQVDLHLDKHVDKPTTIYSGDLRSTDPTVKPVSAKIPIVKLEKNMALVIEAFARLGTGREHAKYQAVSTTAYRHYPEVTVDESKCGDCKDACEAAKWCPKHLFEKKGKKVQLVEDWWKRCTVCMECQSKCPNGAITARGLDDKFIMFLESTGALPVRTVLFKAIEIFKATIREFLTQVEETAHAQSEN